MAMSTVMSVASFSVVLGEAFAAVGLSSLVPAGVVTLARLAKNLPAGAPSAPTQNKTKTALDKTPAKPVLDLVMAMADSLPSLDLLLPKTAKIHAEFTFEGSERIAEEIGGGLAIDVVSVKAGFSYLYETKSTNKITLDVDFVSVNVTL